MDDVNDEMLDFTASIVAAYVSNNSVPAADIGALIRSVHAELARASGTPAAASETAAPLTPAVSIKKSVTPDYLVCLEDGKTFKSLKRHLMSSFGMTPNQYRAKWNLPPDYPMTAPNYAEARSAIAKSVGLGRKGVDGSKRG